ncbi:hypothetical protein ABS71_15695 [bacterium SCN 62-11]|nr:phosphotransferase [Candidatus Eremiobacteraeota bacterium]ODT62453.1 MAG: hypothetical protein ABS71_15695 [bacterium SCN 62-11]
MNDSIQKIVKETLGDHLKVTPLSGGRSGASLWLIERDGQRYVVRQSGPNRSEREEICIRLASGRGLAPRLLEARQGVTVMEWSDGQALHRGTPRETDPLGRLAATLRHLHDGPAFPEGPSMLAMYRDLERHLENLPAVIGHTLEATTPELAECGQPAPCHLDLNPSNILATPERIHLVDWELAAQNEPYLDLAQLGIWICRQPLERAELLAKYLQAEPTLQQKRRMHLARLQALSFYAAAFHLVTHMQGRQTVQQGTDLDGVFQEMASTGQSFRPESMAHALLLELHRELEPNVLA